MEVGLVILGLYAVGATVMLFVRTPAAPALPAASSSPAKPSAAKSADDVVAGLEKKLAEARADASAARDKVTAKQKELDELREQARAKARREGKKEARETDDGAKARGPDPRDVEIQSLRKGMAGLESQLNVLKREAAARDASSSEATNRSAAEVEGAKKSAEGEREKRRALEDEVGALKKTIDELRGALKKADARPDVPGTTLNLKELPTPAVQELSRFFRKGEEFERLYTVAQSQLQIEKDRYLELQRRYFAVCRELAVQAGLPANASDAELHKRAEAVLDGADAALAARQARLASSSSPATPAGGSVQAAGTPEGQTASADGRKKRRRRRRRKIAGEPSVVDAADGADGDDGDDGEDGDDGAETNAAASGEGGGDGSSGAAAPA